MIDNDGMSLRSVTVTVTVSILVGIVMIDRTLCHFVPPRNSDGLWTRAPISDQQRLSLAPLPLGLVIR